MSTIEFQTVMNLRSRVGDAMADWLEEQEEAGASPDDAWDACVKVLMGMAAIFAKEGMDCEDFMANAKLSFEIFSERDGETLQ